MIRAVLTQGQAAAEVRVDLNLEHGASLVESVVFKTLAVWMMEEFPVPDCHQIMTNKPPKIKAGFHSRFQKL